MRSFDAGLRQAVGIDERQEPCLELGAGGSRRAALEDVAELPDPRPL